MSLVWSGVLCALLAVGTTTASAISPLLHLRDDQVTSLGNADLSFSKVNDQLFSLSEDEITCITCETFGTAQVTTSGIPDLSEIIKDLGKDITDVSLREKIAGNITPNITISFLNTSATFDLNTNLSASVTHSFPLLSQPLLGATFNEGLDNIGINLVLDLIITVTAHVDISSTFEMSIPDGASITFDPIHAAILNSTGFSGTGFNVKTSLEDPEVGFAASLRATILAGVGIHLPHIPGLHHDISTEFDVGVFADLVKYEANITSSDEVALIEQPESLPSTTATTTSTSTAMPPYSLTNRTLNAASSTPSKCANVLTESLSIDLGIFGTATFNATEADDHFDEPGSINVFTHAFLSECL